LWERIIEGRLRKEISILENQFDFMPDRSTTEAIHLIRRLMKVYQNRKKDLHMVFIDLKKAYDRVPREVLWECLAKGGYPSYQGYVRGGKTSVRSSIGDTEYFSIDIRLHQGSALNPFLFTIIIDELTREIQEEVPWCMLFADDIVLIDETKGGLNEKLERWRHRLESRGFRLGRSKTEYLRCGISRVEEDGGEVTMCEIVVVRVEKFKYLGSIVEGR